MPEDRAEMQEARNHGLKARHETREARAIRRGVANEIADAMAARALQYPEWTQRDVVYDMETIAREIGSRDPA